MISFGKKRGWPQEDEAHGAAAVAMDGDHRVLFIISPTPLSIHDFILTLLRLPIDIRYAMYVEGGPEASLHILSGSERRTFSGTCGADPSVYDERDPVCPIPNVIGIQKKGKEIP